MSTTQHTPLAGALRAAHMLYTQPPSYKLGHHSRKGESYAETADREIAQWAAIIDRETAAPELLAIALKILADHEECLAAEQPGFLTSTEECELRAAIAKAKGES